MGTEIEKKFLVHKKKWSKATKGNGILIKQGYISTDPNRTVRIRVTGNKGFLTIKGPSKGPVRSEFEYPIPLTHARALLQNGCGAVISKKRYTVKHAEKQWMVDEFQGDNEGLIIAEIELKDPKEKFELPEWAGKEVTDKKKYFNARLSLKPYKKWKK